MVFFFLSMIGIGLTSGFVTWIFTYKFAHQKGFDKGFEKGSDLKVNIMVLMADSKRAIHKKIVEQTVTDLVKADSNPMIHRINQAARQ